MRVDRPFRGIGLMLMGSALITLNDAAVKLVLDDHSVSQAILVRGVFAFVVIVWLVRRAGGWEAARWRSLRAQLPCAAPLITSLFLFVFSLSRIPIAPATVILYMSPLFLTALAPLLGERVGWRRWGAVLLGFVGTVLVIEPAGDTFTWFYLVPVCAAFVLALRDLATRKLVESESSVSILLVSAIAVLISAAPGAAMSWRPLDPGDTALLALSGLAFGFAMFCLTDAFRYADASLVSPFKYAGVIVAALVGFAIWGDVPSLSAVTGGALIVMSGLFVLRREQALASEP
ncbi:MAG: DMT family transporter [Hyphomicrobiales bacterium]